MAGTANRSAAPAATPPAIAPVILLLPAGDGVVGERGGGGDAGRGVNLVLAKLQIIFKQLINHSDMSTKSIN